MAPRGKVAREGIAGGVEERRPLSPITPRQTAKIFGVEDGDCRARPSPIQRPVRLLPTLVQRLP